MSSLYNEVTAAYSSDRVLDKLSNPLTGLPYSIDDIKISHNDFAIADIYNDSIKKLYSNYLFLIANAQIVTKTSPTSALFGLVTIDDNGEPTQVGFGTTTESPTVGHLPQLSSTSATAKLSSIGEIYVTNKIDSPQSGNGPHYVYFNYGVDSSIVFESSKMLPGWGSSANVNSILSGNEVEFNKTFKFSNVVSVASVNNFLFVLDAGLETLFKFDVTGLLTNDPAVKRTSVTDTSHPGRYLVKSIGVNTQTTAKNKFKKPSCISIHDGNIYVVDNGNFSIKVFDLELNYIRDYKSRVQFDPDNSSTGRVVSMVVGKTSNTDSTPVGFLLTQKGNIFKYNVLQNRITNIYRPFKRYDTRLNALSAYNEPESFKKIVQCKTDKNILYVSTTRTIYKFYNTNFNLPITTVDLNKAYIRLLDKTSTAQDDPWVITDVTSNLDAAQEILSFDTFTAGDPLHEAIAVTTTTLSPDASARKTGTYIFGDDNTPTKLYNETFYNNYFTLSDIIILPQEIVNNITFNKTIKKLIYNHFSFFENLDKKIFTYYNTFKVPTLCTVTSTVYNTPSSFSIDDNFYVGINEPILTDVINRTLYNVYRQQVDLYDLIKDNYLNNNPPSDVFSLLPASVSATQTNLLSLDDSSQTVSSGDTVSFTVSRQNLTKALDECRFVYYIELDTATSDDLQVYPTKNTPHVGLFETGETQVSIDTIVTNIFYSGSETRTFKILIEPYYNCEVNPTAYIHTVTLTGQDRKYTISLSADNPTFIARNSQERIGIIRTDNSDDETFFTQPASCNIKFIRSNIALTEFLPTPVAGATQANQVATFIEDDFQPVNNVFGQVSASEISTTSTLYFSPGVSSIIFDLSAANTFKQDTDQSITMVIERPDTASIIATDGTSEHIISFSDFYSTVNLHVSSISASYIADVNSSSPSTTLLSSVNIWQALSADSTYQDVSGLGPVNINFTFGSKDGAAPLSAFSKSTLSGAITFTPSSMAYTKNSLTLIIEANHAVVGKGGQGGHGAVWRSGWHATDETAGTAGAGYLSADYHEGEDGGPAIWVNTDFLHSGLTINNYGELYGGAGGGGGGILPLSAESMLEGSNGNQLTALSAAAGGGGGRGIHTKNAGAGGQAGVGLQGGNEDEVDMHDPGSDWPKVNDGSAGTTSAGGAGGGLAGGTTITTLQGNVDITQFPQITGLSGGNFGSAGQTDPTDLDSIASWVAAGFDDESDAPTLTAASYENLRTDDYRDFVQRIGGVVGDIVGQKGYYLTPTYTNSITGQISGSDYSDG